jgi:hypothetical protein
MTQTFHELVFGGVLFAPFLAYAGVALVIFLALRPLLHLIGFSKIFSHASIAELSLFVTLVGTIVLLA